MLRAKQNLGSTNSWRILVLPKAVLQRDAVAHVATPLRCDARRAVGVGSEVGAEPVQDWGLVLMILLYQLSFLTVLMMLILWNPLQIVFPG